MQSYVSDQIAEFEQTYRKSIIDDGYIEIPANIQKYLGNAEWIHKEELKQLKKLLEEV